MKHTRAELEKALELAVKVVVHYDDGSDCNGRCPLYADCPIHPLAEDFTEPRKACLRHVKKEFLALAKAKGVKK